MKERYTYLRQTERIIVTTPKGFEFIIETDDDERADEIIVMVEAANTVLADQQSYG